MRKVWIFFVDRAIAMTKYLKNNLNKNDPSSGYYEALDSYSNLCDLKMMLEARLNDLKNPKQPAEENQWQN